ncbi:cysteine/serine-rich nuclear protein 2 [Protopterus annectens]|uniref:cysteine/serine-rich nuclear protein 2 n=1 Tax=Protopterus annectens TaxID=7888 RepID=UPI001CFA81A1|nr:cysteine/serine-rich nuclear protein 2 [Protopterus annectens]
MDAVTSRTLKRKFDEVAGGSPLSTPKDSDDEISSSDSADSCDSINPPTTTEFIPTSILKQQKQLRRKNVRFDQVTVYYFARRQGFTSVPSQGGSSLGMAQRHNSVRRYTLCEFAKEQEINHREILREHLREEKLHARKMKLTKNGTVESEEAEGLTLEDVSDDDIDVDSVEVDDYFFLQPLPTKRRRALLRASGVNRIDAEEKQELRAIRLSREECGCDCRLYCDPDVCTCSQAGIKCQVDRMSFPCGCSRDGCANTVGRIEFNPIRVRTHYLHTIMKLDAESKQRQQQHQHRPEGPPLNLSRDLSCEHIVETQDYHEFIAENCHLENETAVMHLQTAEELERMKEEEAESTGSLASLDSSVESLGVCILEDPLAVTDGVCGVSASPVLIQAELPAGSSVLCFTDSPVQGSSCVDGQSFLNGGSVVYYQIDQASVLSIKDEASTAATEVPSAYKDSGVDLITFTGSSVAHCNTVIGEGTSNKLEANGESSPLGLSSEQNTFVEVRSIPGENPDNVKPTSQLRDLKICTNAHNSCLKNAECMSAQTTNKAYILSDDQSLLKETIKRNAL